MKLTNEQCKLAQKAFIALAQAKSDEAGKLLDDPDALSTTEGAAKYDKLITERAMLHEMADAFSLALEVKVSP